jgi:hypothetical protein
MDARLPQDPKRLASDAQNNDAFFHHETLLGLASVPEVLEFDNVEAFALAATESKRAGFVVLFV